MGKPLIVHLSPPLRQGRYYQEYLAGDPLYFIGTWGALIARRLKKRHSHLQVESWRADWNVSRPAQVEIDGMLSRLFPMRGAMFNKTITAEMFLKLWLKQWSGRVIINYHGLFGLLPSLLPIMFPRARIVLFHHGGTLPGATGLLSRVKILIFKITRKRVALFTYLNDETRDFLALQGVAEKSVFLPVGADFAKFGKISKDEARRTLGLPKELCLGIYVGPISSLKGVDHIIDSMQDIDKAKANVILIGPESPEEKSLCERAKDSGMIMTGRLDWLMIPQYLAAADFYIHPVFVPRVGFDVSLIEAMASGLPVISSRLGLIDCERGLLGISISRPQELKQAMFYMIDHFGEYKDIREITENLLDANKAIPDKILSCYMKYCALDNGS